MPFTPADVRRMLSVAIVQTNTAPQDAADRIAETLANVLTPALRELVLDGPLMTAAEALFVRDTVASELEAIGGGPVAERLIVAGYIDVAPILSMHRRKPETPPSVVGQLTGPIPVPIAVPPAPFTTPTPVPPAA